MEFVRLFQDCYFLPDLQDIDQSVDQTPECHSFNADNNIKKSILFSVSPSAGDVGWCRVVSLSPSALQRVVPLIKLYSGSQVICCTEQTINHKKNTCVSMSVDLFSPVHTRSGSSV